MSDLLEQVRAALSDRYRLERELGQGGMATVYLAEDLKHERKVAVKVLRPELAAVLGADRFNREIHIAAQLQHPHILPLLDSGQAGGFLYYVMPYVPGESLRERLAKHGELPVHEAVRLLTEVVDALADAHAHGVVHRDIKPDNVLMSGRHALVTDFGVAKAVSEASGRRTLTTAGVAIGTPAYMAPEQAAADPHQDHRVDIYAVGCLGYELLSGRPPFSAMTPQEMLAAQVTQIPEPVERHRSAVPATLSAVLMKCLAKRAADRWQSAEELLAQLEPLSTTSGGSTPTESRPIATAVPVSSSRRWVFALGAVAGMAGVALLATRFSRLGATDIRLGRRVQATLAPGLEIFPALSPKGDLLAYIGGADTRLYVRQVEGGNPIPAAPDLPGQQMRPHWSPDGKSLSFNSVRGLEVVPALGGTPRLLVARPKRLTNFNPGSWSPDGRELLLVSGDTLYVVTLETGSSRALATAPELHSCAWSPKGAWIACVRGNWASIQPGIGLGNLAPSAIALIPATGGQFVLVTQDSSANASPAWLPEGTLIFVSDRDGGRDVYALRLSRRGRPSGSPRRLTTGLNALSISLAADGSRMGYAVFTETSNIWSLAGPRRGVGLVSQASQVTSGTQVIEGFDISPDGEWLVFDSDRSGNSDIYRSRLNGKGDPEQLTRSPVSEFFPAWSPDGREIAFHSFREGRRQVYTMSADGGAVGPVALTNDDDRIPIWLPDGTGVLLQTNLHSDTNETRVVTRLSNGSWSAPRKWRKPSCVPTWSPDTGRAACMTRRGQFVITDDKGDSVGALTEQSPIRGSARLAGWSPDGSKVYFLSADSAGTNISSVPASGGPGRVVIRFDDPSRPWHRYGFEVFRDRFYFTVGDLQSDIWVTEVASP